MVSGFLHFLRFEAEFGNKEFMIWATVSSQSGFCWLYTASPSLAAMNIINLILVSTIWWCPCVESSLVLLSHKKKRILPFATMWMELENIMFIEISQRKRNTLRLSFICGIYKNKQMYITKHKLTHRYGGKTTGYQQGEEWGRGEIGMWDFEIQTIFQ